MRLIKGKNKRALKLQMVPKDFVLVIDTDEKLPLFEGWANRISIVHQALSHGDYSLLGFENQLAIERKRESDLLSYIGSERSRTNRKIRAMHDHKFKAIVVEEDYSDLMSGLFHYSQKTPQDIWAFMRWTTVMHGFHWFFDSDRRACEFWILDHLISGYNLLREV